MSTTTIGLRRPKNSYLVFSYFRARACWLAATFFSFFVECCRAVPGLVQSRARPGSVPTTRQCRCTQLSCSQAQQAAVAVLVLLNYVLHNIILQIYVYISNLDLVRTVTRPPKPHCWRGVANFRLSIVFNCIYSCILSCRNAES